jgi:RNA polymerase sigma-70 factor (ECF subfamily)
VSRYISAWESANVDALVELLCDDARLSMPPVPSWYRGPASIGAFLRHAVLPPDAGGTFRAIPTRANGRQAVALYQRGGDDAFALMAVQVLDTKDGALADIVVFMEPSLLEFFELPPTLAG